MGQMDGEGSENDTEPHQGNVDFCMFPSDAWLYEQ